MIAKEKYVKGNHIHLVEEKCIEVIERELDTFFEVRLKFIYLIHDLYIKDSIKNSNDILEFLNLSDYEIEGLIQTMVYKISNIISSNFSQYITYFNRYYIKEKYMYYVEDSINEFTKTEMVLSICDRFLDKSLSMMFKTCCQDKVLNYVFIHSKPPEKILGNNGLKHQKQKHSNIIAEQVKGFLLNLKCDLRNDLLKSILLLVNSVY